MYAGNLNRDIPAFFRKPKMEAAVVLLSEVYGNCNLLHLDAERRKGGSAAFDVGSTDYYYFASVSMWVSL